jgi:hypothetical protein
MKRDVGEVSNCCPKVKKDLTNMERELAKLKEEMRATRPKAEPLAPPAVDVVFSPAVGYRRLLPGSHLNHRHLFSHCRNLYQ